MYSGRIYHSTTSGPYDLLLAGQPNDTCICASGAPFFTSGLRWTPRMVTDVEVVVVHLLLANVVDLTLVVVPASTCNIFQ